MDLVLKLIGLRWFFFYLRVDDTREVSLKNFYEKIVVLKQFKAFYVSSGKLTVVLCIVRGYNFHL